MDERRQDNDDKKRLARYHPSDLLRSLTRERDRQKTAPSQQHFELHHFVRSNFPHARLEAHSAHACVYLVPTVIDTCL